MFLGRQQIGVVTSGVRSPILGKTIALARVSVEHGHVGTDLEIGKLDGLQKRLSATVVPAPHFDPGKERMKM